MELKNTKDILHKNLLLTNYLYFVIVMCLVYYLSYTQGIKA